MFAFAAEAAIALEITRRERQLRELQMQLAHTNIAALHFLDRNPPDLQEVREALAAVKDADHRQSNARAHAESVAPIRSGRYERGSAGSD